MNLKKRLDKKKISIPFYNIKIPKPCDKLTKTFYFDSFLSVEMMRLGASPAAATETAVRRMAKYYPNFRGAVIALNKAGEYGAACHGYQDFPHYISNVKTMGAKELSKPCLVLEKN